MKAGRRIDTDGTKLKLAIDRLITVGVIDKAATRTTHPEAMGGDEAGLLNCLYSDPAVLHFVQIGRTFQMELMTLWPCSPEVAAMNMFPALLP